MAEEARKGDKGSYQQLILLPDSVRQYNLRIVLIFKIT